MCSFGPMAILALQQLAQLRAEVGMVFQSFNLFANKTILENVTLAPIKVRHMDKKAAEDLAMDLLGVVDGTTTTTLLTGNRVETSEHRFLDWTLNGKLLRTMLGWENPPSDCTCI